MSIYTILTPKETLVQQVRNDNRIIATTFQGEDVQVTDSYHTMDELYKHRYALFIALCKIYDNYVTPLNAKIKCWKAKLHSDGTMFEDSFLLGMTVTNYRDNFQITYHLPLEYWNKINVIAYEKAPPYDGHTSQDVIERLLKL